MLAELRLYLETGSSEFGYYQSSNLQGVLMERIDGEYGEILHLDGLKPYSQFLYCRKGLQWVIRTTTEEAYNRILLPLMRPDFTSFTIKKKEIDVRIVGKEIHTMTKKRLLEDFYSLKGERDLSVEFQSPTGFKQNGRYVNYPDLRLLFQSLMNKYSAGSQDMDMFDEETLEQLVQNITLSRYSLHSVGFPLEGIRIPAFMGHMTIHIRGNNTLANYCNLLLRFGEFSGVGIKTGMGMGAIRRVEKEKI